ncbi:MAG: hypothetical protein WC428_06485 [Candidatus Paceibacterota bacterium]|jgi:hypothetical protein
MIGNSISATVTGLKLYFTCEKCGLFCKPEGEDELSDCCQTRTTRWRRHRTSEDI